MSARPNPDDLLSQAVRLVEPALAEALERLQVPRKCDGPAGSHVVPERLVGAMRYAVFTPGKRLRPALVIGAARAVGAKVPDVLPAACAVEMVHAYSLVHDDLPAIDDDDIRRGKPSCHRQFDEATALLAGDALLTEALSLVADDRPLGRGTRISAERRVRATIELSRAIGAGGMVGGQQDDVDADDTVGNDHVRTIHRRKTGRLIQAAAALGAIFGGAKVREVDMLRRFGADVGLAFQLVDDVLDGDGIARHGAREAARNEALELTRQANERLRPFGRRARPLCLLAERMAERIK